MKELINNIITFLQAAITDGDISAKIVKKGFDQSEPDQIPIERYPYIEVDDGGERVESETSANVQTRVYSVNIFMAVISGDVEKSLDDILDLSDEVKTEFEKEENRQLDGHTWGINIIPVDAPLDNNKFFRGRQVVIEFNTLEDTFGEF